MIGKAKLKKMYDYIMLGNEHGLIDEEEAEARKRNYDRFSKLYWGDRE